MFQIENAAEAIEFEYAGKTYSMRPDEIEAAYHYKDHLYGMEDAKRHIMIECFGHNCPSFEIGDTEVSVREGEDMESFKERFGVSYVTVMEHLDLVYGAYALVQRSELSDNENWYIAICQACESLKGRT